MVFTEKKKLAVVSPEGETFYLKENNPYVVYETDTHSLLPRITTPQNLIEKAIKLEKMNCSVRFICLFDVFLSTYYFLFGWWPGLLFLIISINGYMATILYKKSLMCCYMYYQYIQTSIRLINLIFYIAEVSDIEHNNQSIVQLMDTKNSTIGIIILTILLGFQCYVTYFFQKYYKLLPTDSEREQYLLNN